MSVLMSIDPATNLGLAVFKEGELFAAGFYTVKNYRDLTKHLVESAEVIKPGEVVIEYPQIYDPRNWRGDPNDLLKVALIGGICVAAVAPYCEAELVTPHAWKGSRPKAIDNDYTYSLLNTNERFALDSNQCPKARRHDVLDAIGIGLWKLKRR